MAQCSCYSSICLSITNYIAFDWVHYTCVDCKIETIQIKPKTKSFFKNLNSLLSCFCTCYFCFSKIVYIVQKPIQDTLLCKWNFLYIDFLTYFTMSMKDDSLFVCPKFWKTFKNEVSTNWSWSISQGGYQRSKCLNVIMIQFSSTKADLNLEG